MQRSKTRSLLLGGLLLYACASQAGTLGQAVDAALALDQQAGRPQALRGESTAVRAQADSLVADDPALRVKYLSDRFNRNDGATEWEAMVDLPLWLPGQRDARRAVAASLGVRADALEGYLRWELAGRVREAAWDAAIAGGRLRQAEEALAAARRLETNVGKRVQTGDLAQVDLLTARQETLAMEVEREAATQDLARAMERYLLLTGQAELPTPLAEPALPAAELPADHPGLLAAEASVRQARAERERARNERRANPTLSLGGKHWRDGRGADDRDALQLEIGIPFGLGSQAAPRIAAAERAYTDSEAERARARRELDEALGLARTAYEGTHAVLAVASRRQALASEALAQVERGFELGEIDLNSLLRSRENAREAQLDLELKRLEQGRAAARLNQALGVVPR